MYDEYDFGDLRRLNYNEYEYLETQMSKVGKRMFVEHYYAFKRKDRSILDKCPPNMKPETFRKRALAAFTIFDFNLEMHALYKILYSPQLPREILITAKQIYEYESLMSEYLSKQSYLG
ncbi:MAG: hypothetical protein E7633_10580 [Ruminococcaceae bacterium]|nr:hypothetical protein [Oscillospiraceae bacterium]